ncbi:hypothetical protein MMC30_006052 [Trapelia coarctata]|nr:hypothetical protein [Trapelia coarctata]
MHFTKSCVLCFSLAAFSAGYLGPNHYLHALRARDAYPEAFTDSGPAAYAETYPDAYADQEHELDNRGLYERYAEADAYPGASADAHPDAYAEEEHDLDDRDLYERYAEADAEAEPGIPNHFIIPGQIIGSLSGLGGEEDMSSSLERGLHERDAAAEAYPNSWDEQIDFMLHKREVFDPTHENSDWVPTESLNGGPVDQATGHKNRFPYEPTDPRGNPTGPLNPPHMRWYDTQPAPGNSASIGAQQASGARQAHGSAQQEFRAQQAPSVERKYGARQALAARQAPQQALGLQQATGGPQQTFGAPQTPELQQASGAQPPIGAQQVYGTQQGPGAQQPLAARQAPQAPATPGSPTSKTPVHCTGSSIEVQICAAWCRCRVGPKGTEIVCDQMPHTDRKGNSHLTPAHLLATCREAHQSCSCAGTAKVEMQPGGRKLKLPKGYGLPSGGQAPAAGGKIGEVSVQKKGWHEPAR